MIGIREQPMTWFGLPPDAVAWVALGAALVLLAQLSVEQARRRSPSAAPAPSARPGGGAPFSTRDKGQLLVLGGFAAALSAGYFAYYLGGAPRVIDATTYLLEARTFATGSFSFPVPEPTALFRGRFLLPVSEHPGELAPIFPPGYPALLALFVRLGDYRWLGPLLAAGVTWATAWLAWELSADRRIAWAAGLLSTLSATLRYQTADTMSHGLTILLVTVMLTTSIRLLRDARKADFVLLGLCAGLCIATRPLTGLLAVLAICVVLGGRLTNPAGLTKPAGVPWVGVSLGLLACLPGVGLLLWQQAAVLGDPWASLQLAYYRASDGPPGCFGLGLGRGCRFEHGDVVLEQGGHGLTPLWMLRNTLYRLHWHSLDVANFEPLWLASLLGLWRLRGSLLARPLLIFSVLLPGGYALFYFQGSYPGGGARFLSELIPVMQVGLAAVLVRGGWLRPGIALCLGGFALHGAHLHRALPGMAGIPSLPETRDDVRVAHSDTAFNLHFQPAATSSGRAPSVQRSTSDDRRLRPGVEPRPLRLEAERDWPLRNQKNAWTMPGFIAAPCVSQGRGLWVFPLGTESSLSLEATGIPTGTYKVTAHLADEAGHCWTEDLGAWNLPGLIDYGPDSARRRASKPARLLDRLEAIPLRKHTPVPKKR